MSTTCELAANALFAIRRECRIQQRLRRQCEREHVGVPDLRRQLMEHVGAETLEWA
jgi:hypothetical protein